MILMLLKDFHSLYNFCFIVALFADENTNAASIVNAVGTLAKAKHLLHIDDLDTYVYFSFFHFLKKHIVANSCRHESGSVMVCRNWDR